MGISNRVVTVPAIRQRKQTGPPIVMVTAYDYPTARLADEAGIDIVLVGDSLANVILGYNTTLPVTMQEMIHHTKAVHRGISRALLVADMPFLSFSISIPETIRNAGRFIKEAGATAVKIEGGSVRVDTVRALVENEIPVMGHLGLTPQSVHRFGGYRIQGKSEDAVQILLQDARDLEAAGAFSIVLEGITRDAAKQITQTIGIPTIGIGAGPDCTGQVLVLHDLLGLTPEPVAKFVKQYARIGDDIRTALETYAEEVRRGAFPEDKHCYTVVNPLTGMHRKQEAE